MRCTVIFREKGATFFKENELFGRVVPGPAE